MKTRLFVLSLLLIAALPAAHAQEAVLAPNENLVAEGVPPVPASLAEKVLRYTESRSASLSSWHPVKREMLISTRFADSAQLHMVRMPGGARTQLTFFADRVAGGGFQPTHGKYALFSKDIGGGEWFQIFRLDLATGESTMLTDGKSRNTGRLFNKAGDRIAFGSTRRNRKDLDLYVMDPMDPAGTKMLLELEGGGWGASDWSPDGKSILLFEFISVNESYIWQVDVASATKKLLTPKGGAQKISYSGGAFSHDGNGLYVTTDKDSEFQRLAYIDLATMKHTFLTAEIPWDVEGWELSDNGKTIAYVTNEDGISRLHLMNTVTRRSRPAANIPVGLIGGLNWHKNNRDLGFNINSAKSPTDIYSLNILTNALTRWTESETGGLQTASLSEPELVKWKSFDGKMISGFLYRPPARFTGKRPVIVSIHGGPEGQSRPGFAGRSNYYLNELGVAVLLPNIRGSEGYGKTFLMADNGMKRVDSYKDIDALLDWIKASPDLDGDRIMITGGSYGGHMTLAIATHYNAKIRCSLAVVAMSNLVTFLENTESYRRDLRRAEYGDERDPAMRAYMTEHAPMTMARNITKPLFVVQGKNDPRVPISEANQMVETVRLNKTPVWYLVGKDEGHGFAKKKNADFQFYSTILFIQENLLK